MPPLSLQVSAKAFRAGRISRQRIQLAKIPEALLIAKISMKRDCKLLFPTRPNRHVQIVRITAAISHQANLPQAEWIMVPANWTSIRGHGSTVLGLSTRFDRSIAPVRRERWTRIGKMIYR